jgi:hypothetical protein
VVNIHSVSVNLPSWEYSQVLQIKKVLRGLSWAMGHSGPYNETEELLLLKIECVFYVPLNVCNFEAFDL